MKKYTTKLEVKYSVDVTIDAFNKEEAIAAFESFVEDDMFSAEQLTPSCPVDVEFDGFVWSEHD